MALACYDVMQMLSKAGRTALYNTHNQVPGERTRKVQAKISFVRNHPELWNSPSTVAEALIEARLYGPKPLAVR